MKKLSLSGLLLLIQLCLPAQIPSRLPFLFQVTDWDGEPLASETIRMKLSVVAKFQSILKYSEEHLVVTDDAGVATLIIGEGFNITGSLDLIDWEEGSHLIKAEYRKQGETSWKYLGEKALLSVPFAHSAKHTGSRLWSKTGSALFRQPGNVAIGAASVPYGLELGANHRMLLSNSQKEISSSSSVIFNTPADTSKPAIVFFNPFEKSRAALVAHHYLHYPMEVHQHYSMEVSDSYGQQQTRIEFPWGVDTCLIQNHSSHFSIHGNFSVGDTARAGLTSLGVHTYIHSPGNLVLSPSDNPVSNGQNELTHYGEPSRLLINTPKTDATAKIWLQSGDTTFLLQNRNGRLSFRNDRSTIFLQHKYENGYLTIGAGIPDERLVVEGNIRVYGDYMLLAGSSGMAEYFETEEYIQPGNIAGINPETGLARNYRPGDEIAGVASSESAMAGNYKPGQSEWPLQMIVIAGRVKVSPADVVVRNGMVCTPDGHSLGAQCAEGFVLLR